MLKWTSKYLIGAIFLLWSTGFVSAQPPGKIGKAIEVRFLYPAGKTFRHDTLFPLVIEYQNKSAVAQKFELDWSLDIPIPKAFQSVTLGLVPQSGCPCCFPPNLLASFIA